MKAFFFDSSALVKRYVDEVGSEKVTRLLRATGNRAVLSRFTQLEVTAAIVRRACLGSPGKAAPQVSLAVVDEEFREMFHVIEVGEETIASAIKAATRHALRAADALQLACALSALSGVPNPSEFVFVCADAELNAAAQAENMCIMNPCDEG